MRRDALGWLAAAALGLAAPRRRAAETVADIRAELDLLNGQIEQLRNELVRSGAGARPAGRPRHRADPARPARGRAPAADRPGRRADQRHRPHRRRTRRNRVGDIEFRLTELEGGDTSVGKPEPAPLGGGLTRPRPRPIAPQVAPDAAGAPLAVDRAVGLRRRGGRGRRRRQRQGGGALRRPSSPPIPAGRSRPRRSTAAARRWRRSRTGAARRAASSTPSAARRRTRRRRTRSTSSRSASGSSARPRRPA